MQYIDNDMDELFRKAGENYPLRTDGADWDALQAKLADSSSHAVIYPEKKINRNYLWLLLLLLVPLIMVTYKSDNHTGSHAGTSRRAVASHSTPLSAKPENNSGGTHTMNSPRDTHGNGPQNESMSEPVENKSNALPKISARQSTVKNDRSASSSDATTRSQSLSSKIIFRDDRPVARRSTARNDTHTKIARGDRKINGKNKPSGTGETMSLVEQDPTVKSTNPDWDGAAHSADPKETIPVDSTTAIRQPKQKDSVSIVKPSIRSAQNKKQIAINPNKKGFYYGLIGGPDFSTIKAQKISKAGYSVGALLGYSFTKHWSVEAGVIWDEKKYFTTGKYFNKGGANIPPTVTLHYLDGNCHMLEFPIAIRYDVNMKRNSFFFTAGFTSYLMKKEDYNYGADNNGNYYEGYRTYKNSGNTLFSNLQLSAGYKYNLSKNLSLRIEPYIKMPVKDIGIGKMPISSKGMYIGVMRSIR